MKKRDDIYLREIAEQIRKIRKHLSKLTYKKFQASDLHKSAVVRELEVIGEAARMVSDDTKARHPEIPWKQMTGMRNRLIHGYFDVDYSIVWEVAKNELPNLDTKLDEAVIRAAPPIHPWRLCPYACSDVRPYSKDVQISKKHPDGKADWRAFCRHNPSKKDHLYPNEMRRIMDVAIASGDSLGKIGKILSREYGHANDFDQEILVWTKYWNDIFSPSEPLNPNVVKALLGSESTFNPHVKDVRATKGNLARGPFQVTDQTRNALRNAKGEVKDHYITLSAKEVKEPILGAAASIRWLFYKRERATAYLGRPASWDEAVAQYKSDLKKKNYKEFKGMKNYFKFKKLLEDSE